MNVTQVTRVTRLLSTALAVLLLMVSGAAAQDAADYYVDDYRDVLQVSLYGSLSVPSGGVGDWTTEVATGSIPFAPKTGFGFGVELGYFATPSLVIGAQFEYSRYGIDTDVSAVESRDHQLFRPALYGLYYFFGESDFVPYIKAHAGVDFAKFTTSVIDVPQGNIYEYRELSYDPGFSFGAGVGLFYYTHDYGGLFVEANYHQGMLSGVEGDYEGLSYEFGEDVGLLNFNLGIRVFFGSD
ncbi:outer membrane beta-barrel protein [candidate division GN15 bacterium]|nr:outer membrane beta-barrel protein [candidate division GN15 bacterium]